MDLFINGEAGAAQFAAGRFAPTRVVGLSLFVVAAASVFVAKPLLVLTEVADKSISGIDGNFAIGSCGAQG